MNKKIEFETDAFYQRVGGTDTFPLKAAFIKLPAGFVAGRYRVALEPVEPELKPCPFCGDTAYVQAIDEDEYRVICRGCYGSSTVTNSYEGAVNYWNRRSGE